MHEMKEKIDKRLGNILILLETIIAIFSVLVLVGLLIEHVWYVVCHPEHLLEAENPTAAIYCHTGECEIRITARAATAAEGEKMCRESAKKFYEILGDAIYKIFGLFSQKRTHDHTAQYQRGSRF